MNENFPRIENFLNDADKIIDQYTFMSIISILVLTGMLILIIKLFSIETARALIFRLKPKSKLYHSSGSLPSLPNLPSRINKICDFLKATNSINKIDLQNKMIGEFISINDSHREHILDVVPVIEGYLTNRKKKRPLNIFLNSPPGAGKSFLIKNLVCSINQRLKTKEKQGLKLLYSKQHEINLIHYTDITRLKNRIKKILDSTMKEKPQYVPVIFLDEFDANINSLQAFKNFLSIMWDRLFIYKNSKFNYEPLNGCEKEDEEKVDLIFENYKIGKCIFLFATSYQSNNQDIFSDFLKTAKGRFLNFVFRKIKLNNDFVYKNTYNLKEYLDEQSWIKNREQLIYDFKKQSDIEKVNDFFDRIDFFINMPGYNEYFNFKVARRKVPDLPNNTIEEKEVLKKPISKSNDEVIYFADYENIVIILEKILKYYKVQNVEKRVLFLLTSRLFSSKRDLDRKLYTANCPVGNKEGFLLEHLDKDLQKYFKEIEGRWKDTGLNEEKITYIN
jgi:hypothetical protein